jgi:RNA polymerase primary sigma factor
MAMKQIRITEKFTDRSSKTLNSYLKEVSKIPLLSVDEEVELSRKIKEGDEKALEKLVAGNLRFVISIAKQYASKDVPLEDLIAEGNIGLITAAKRYDETKGFKFISYAVWWIRQKMIQYILEHKHIIKLPGNKITFLNKINKAIETLERKNEIPPTFEEISEYTDIPIDTIKAIYGYNSNVLYLDTPIHSDDTTTIIDIFIPKENTDDFIKKMIDKDKQQNIKKLVKKILTPKEYEIFLDYFGFNEEIPQTTISLANKYNRTNQAISNMIKRILFKIKRSKYFPEIAELIS